MSIIVCSGISKSYGNDVVLENISFSVNKGDKIGVIGVNGAGKSTLFSIISGASEPTSGSVTVASGATIGVLEQINDAHRFGSTVFEAAVSAFSGLIALEKEISLLYDRVNSGEEAVIKAYTDAVERFNSGGGNEFRSKTASLLEKFGFGEEMQRGNADLLSGGEKTKLLMARLILSEPDILLLDEPTNHLDFSACEWLESYISASKKTFLIISHDRYFLDKITDHTLEISHGVSTIYSGGYSVYREKKRALDAAAAKHYELQQREIARLEAFIENQRRWNREKNIIAAESRRKTIDKMVKIEKPKSPEKSISFSIAGSGSRSERVLSVRSLSAGFPGRRLFDDLSFELLRGDRLFVVGANGSGKSTLMKIITGRAKQISGAVEPGYNQTIGYYDQEQQLLTQSNTVIDEIWSVYSDKTATEIRSLLARFGFYGNDVFKSVSVLSGGERARLSVAKMVSCGVSLLVLDEPTNHLDIASREILGEALAAYDGTLLCVSHDRYFIRPLANGILEIAPQPDKSDYRIYKCGYEEYTILRGNPAADAPACRQKAAAGKMSFEEAKQKKNRLRSAKVRYEKLELEIAECEKQLADIRSRLESESVAGDYKALSELYQKQTDAEKKSEAMYEELMELEEFIGSEGE